MGPDQSRTAVPQASFVRPYTNDLYMPVDASRMNNERGGMLPGPITNVKAVRSPNILKTAFTGIWSVITSLSLGPCPRTGHFYHYDEANQTTYIGYGLNSQSVPLFDCWALDHRTDVWREIKLKGNDITPRTGARCSMIGTHLVIFGGYCDPNYFADLHTIDVVSGEVALVKTQGQTPSERSTPIVAIYGQNFYVWGGFNGEFPSELNVLSFQNMTWKQYPQSDVAGRTAVPHAIIGNILYSYGGAKAGGMLMINLDTFQMCVKQTTGTEPPGNVMASGMVAIDRYLFFFGGKANSNWTLMYACDITRLWWFVFHVMPDGETVSIADGSVSEMGLFMLPRIHSFAVSYVRQARKIVAFLGHPEKDPPPLFTVSVGDALSIIHIREDMRDLLTYTTEQSQKQ
ncbi:Kelch motif family protein [Tritrichomonas foetus]|uniref:Kelch motif family protein n=1 Tax=Tritrichomonas foetus TaxID=1144522 RepID=A0A1J4JIP3_9EUKA|nr:Kelch motif family protein [Tritrichomonas foetus]|eukprot:OHS98207.1 Kelch motif family protein [Tritrichomonas foetus]